MTPLFENFLRTFFFHGCPKGFCVIDSTNFIEYCRAFLKLISFHLLHEESQESMVLSIVRIQDDDMKELLLKLTYLLLFIWSRCFILRKIRKKMIQNWQLKTKWKSKMNEILYSKSLLINKDEIYNCHLLDIRLINIDFKAFFTKHFVKFIHLTWKLRFRVFLFNYLLQLKISTSKWLQ